MNQTKSQPPAVDLDELLELFYAPEHPPAVFTRIEHPDHMPQPFNRLLNHEAHMTVTVEAFHGCPVDVHVHQTKFGGSVLENSPPEETGNGRWYAREITLHRKSDQMPVQYGIVRLNIDLLAPEVWREIEGQGTPLGRVLIQHGVLREVELCELWRVIPHQPIAKLLYTPPNSTIYGRTARIFCDYLPAIELLEIVTG